jgi:lipid-A-disaccharide synthase-like uncharacterized protein
MKHDPAPITPTLRRLALAVAFIVALLPSIAVADIVPPLVPPPVPPTLQVPAGHQAFLEGHAIGTQNYLCLPSDASVAWTFVGPQATLFNRWNWQRITHFLSPNPDESDMPRATWQHSLDTSSIWAVAIAASSDPSFVASEAIPWLLLQVVGTQPGPTGGDRLTATTFIQRVHTTGGVVPSTGCVEVTDVGQRAFVPYTADYVFYAAATDE